ncbi:uncharacterized protein LOC135479238 [Liolophura sinensis]|uniref:uncharacterized protein LOC135479238 n=1 Tax=Liolophura sinensis TaxID=3198878 RepID=UPI0031587FF2
MDNKIIYRKLQETDRDSIEDMLYTSFILEDPLEVSLGIECPREARILVEPLVGWALADGVSVVAEHVPSRELAGVCLNTVDSEVKRSIPVPAGDPDCTKMKVVLDFLDDMRDGVDLRKQFSMTKVVDIRIINVLHKYAGKGIGRALVEESLLLAKDHGCVTACAEATGVFSQKLFQCLGFTTVNEVFYSNYIKDGMLVFNNTGIHRSCRLVAKTL